MDSASMAAMNGFLREYQEVLASSSAATPSDEDSKHRAAKSRREIAKAKATERRLRHLNKTNNERVSLRRQERELLEQLDQLRNTGVKVQGEQDPWRSTAVLQREWKLLAERQQQQLKTAVLTRAKVIQRVTELLRHCLLNCETESVLLEGQKQKKQASLFVTFMNELDALYAQTNYVVRDVDFQSCPPETYRFNREWNKGMTFLETSGATVIPLDFAQTFPAFSALVLAPGYDLEIQDDDNTAARAYHLDFSEDLGYNATLQIYLTLRRYVEDGRIVIVWRGLAEGRGEYKDLYMDESGWFILSPVSPRDGQEPATLLQTCIRLMPIGFDLESNMDTRASRFVKLRMRADEADVNDMEQMMAKLMQSCR
ncbi:hypothetical protein DVH05_027023 [Phytophthora capsici]|nr:hypothetical protein DVH05_027023 [Phytophthora capsici]